MSVFAKPKGKAARRFEELVAQRADRATRVRNMRAQHEAAVREVKTLEQALLKARAAEEVGDLLGPNAPAHDNPRNIEKQLAKARKLADGQLTTQAGMLDEAARRLDGELERLRSTARNELLAELQPDADRAAARVEAALRELLDAHAGWRDVERRCGAVLPPDELRSRPIPDLGFDDVRRAVRRRLEQPVPPPAPSGIGRASPPPAPRQVATDSALEVLTP